MSVRLYIIHSLLVRFLSYPLAGVMRNVSIVKFDGLLCVAVDVLHYCIVLECLSWTLTFLTLYSLLFNAVLISEHRISCSRTI